MAVYTVSGVRNDRDEIIFTNLRERVRANWHDIKCSLRGTHSIALEAEHLTAREVAFLEQYTRGEKMTYVLIGKDKNDASLEVGT